MQLPRVNLSLYVVPRMRQQLNAYLVQRFISLLRLKGEFRAPQLPLLGELLSDA
jgi:hypothetical protein